MPSWRVPLIHSLKIGKGTYSFPQHYSALNKHELLQQEITSVRRSGTLYRQYHVHDVLNTDSHRSKINCSHIIRYILISRISINSTLWPPGCSIASSSGAFSEKPRSPPSHLPVLFLPSLSNSCRHNYTRLRSTCASAACLEQLMPGRQSVQWEEKRRGEEREKRMRGRDWDLKKTPEKNPPFMFSRRKKEL